MTGLPSSTTINRLPIDVGLAMVDRVAARMSTLLQEHFGDLDAHTGEPADP